MSAHLERIDYRHLWNQRLQRREAGEDPTKPGTWRHDGLYRASCIQYHAEELEQSLAFGLENGYALGDRQSTGLDYDVGIAALLAAVEAEWERAHRAFLYVEREEWEREHPEYLPRSQRHAAA